LVGFDVGTQMIEPSYGVSENGSEALKDNYVAAFLIQDPSAVVLAIESLANLTREKYGPCGLSKSTLPISLIAEVLQRKMLPDMGLEVTVRNR
jgi:hypothetical protein